MVGLYVHEMDMSEAPSETAQDYYDDLLNIFTAVMCYELVQTKCGQLDVYASYCSFLLSSLHHITFTIPKIIILVHGARCMSQTLAFKALEPELSQSLTEYLLKRKLPTTLIHDKINIDHFHIVFKEYFSDPEDAAHTIATMMNYGKAKMLTVHLESDYETCVGLVCTSEREHTIKMQGIMACPFYRHANTADGILTPANTILTYMSLKKKEILVNPIFANEAWVKKLKSLPFVAIE